MPRIINGSNLREFYEYREQQEMNREAQRLFGDEARRNALPKIRTLAKAKIDPYRQNSNLIIATASISMLFYYTIDSGITAGLIAGCLTAISMHYALSKLLDIAQKQIEDSTQVTMRAVYPR